MKPRIYIISDDLFESIDFPQEKYSTAFYGNLKALVNFMGYDAATNKVSKDLPDLVIFRLSSRSEPSGVDFLEMMKGENVGLVVITDENSSYIHKNHLTAINSKTGLIQSHNGKLDERALFTEIEHTLGKIDRSSEAQQKKNSFKTLFVIEDDDKYKEIHRSVGDKLGYHVKIYEDHEDAMIDIRSGMHPDLIIMNSGENKAGVNMLQWLHDTGKETPSIMVTNDSAKIYNAMIRSIAGKHIEVMGKDLDNFSEEKLKAAIEKVTTAFDKAQTPASKIADHSRRTLLGIPVNKRLSAWLNKQDAPRFGFLK